jgi:hypothetical protein
VGPDGFAENASLLVEFQGDELGGRKITKTAVRPVCVVFGPLAIEKPVGFENTLEEFAV